MLKKFSYKTIIILLVALALIFIIVYLKNRFAYYVLITKYDYYILNKEREDLKVKELQNYNLINSLRNGIDTCEKNHASKVAELVVCEKKLQNEIEKQADNYFKLDNAKVGDEVGGLKIASISRNSAGDYIIKFSGLIKVTGKFHKEDDFSMTPGLIFFEPNTESQKLIPKVSGDSRTSDFVFENQPIFEKAVNSIKDGDTITVIIDNYEKDLPFLGREGWDTAKFIKIMS